jgi:ubiquitin carboxyl-terminal hydrolase 9/24
MNQIIGILVEQQPTKVGQFERNCVQESLAQAVTIVSNDLEIQLERGPTAVCKTIDTLATVFNKKKAYYKGHKGNWNVNHLSGLPEVRLKMIDRFRQEQGFHRLYRYMMERINPNIGPLLGNPMDDENILASITDENGLITTTTTTTTTTADSTNTTEMTSSTPTPTPTPTTSPTTSTESTGLPQPAATAGFPTIDQLHHILLALAEALPSPRNAAAAASAAANANDNPKLRQMSASVKDTEDSAIELSTAVMQYITSCSEDALKKIPAELLTTIQNDLQKIFDRLLVNRRASTYKFYAFWRTLIWKLITSQSLPLKLFGWQQVDDILDASSYHRPPPRSYIAKAAGCTFVNGEYVYNGTTTADGYVLGGTDVCFERKIPDDEEDGGGKKLTLFRCTMRSQQKWWFLSEADEEQPGTDRDIDYYQHKSKEHEEMEPPYDGWITCRNAGIEPPPVLLKQGRMVPEGEEFNTLEHQLAKWAIENGVIELVLGDSVHREIVARSTPLLKFLASMCEFDTGVESVGQQEPNKYCLQTSHLLLAWKTCTRKADAAVSAQVYQLLVSILPSCPSSLAIPLLKAVQDSLFQNSKDKQENLIEVGEFCTALAVANSSENSKIHTTMLSNEVRAEVLELLWSVLTHPDASTLKTYDTLKRYVTNELRVEPEGSKHRENYLRSCVAVLTENAKQHNGGTIDESQALRMVKLTHFVLEACPRSQAAQLVNDGTGALPLLIFNELLAFLKRWRNGQQTPPRKVG